MISGMSDDITTVSSKVDGRDPRSGQFLPGHTGMGGRPRGARSKLTTQFLDDLHTTWETHGKTALERCAIEEPAQFVRVVAGLLPREANLNVEQQTIFADISDYSQAFAMAVGIIACDPPPLPALEHDDDAV
jgi:hypothetical protein